MQERELVRLLLGHKEARDRMVRFQKLCGSEIMHRSIRNMFQLVDATVHG